MDQLHDCIVKLQSFFSDPNSQLEQPIEEGFQELQMIFVNSQGEDFGDQSWYYDKLRECWQMYKRKGNLQHARQQLQEIIDKYNRLSFYGNTDVVSQNISLKQEVEMLKMQLDTKNRKEMQDQKDVQHFQHASEEIQNLKQIVKKYQKDLLKQQELQKEERKRFQEKIEYMKKQQPAKPFEVKQLQEENASLKQMNLDLIKELQILKEQLATKDFLIQDTKELCKLKEEVEKLHNENRQLEDQIQQLYDKLDLSKQNNLENLMSQMEQQMKVLNIELKKSNEENKVLLKKIEQLKFQNQKFTDKSLEPLNIRCLPEMKGVQSHFHTVMHLLEVIQPFSQTLTVTNKVSQIILKFISYIRKETEQVTAQSANTLIETLGVEFQNDNKANDFLFQIIDHLSKALLKKDPQKSQIAAIIQTDDSPIYDMFFFLQRVFPMELEIQRNEVPLINSIKHIRYLDTIIKPGIEFSEYLKGLIKLEGQENMIDDKESDFNFLIFPNYLVLNVCELSLQKADIKINHKLLSNCLNSAIEDYEYQLIAIVHCNEISQYSITLCKNNIWVQILQDQVQSVQINDLLSFKQPNNDKEMLIYKRNK